MQSIPETPLLKFRHDTLKVVRSEVNLDSEERVIEAIIILEAWIKKQAHFVMSDYSKDYLEKTIVISKGLVERAKQRMDKLCTLRTLMPEFFTVEPDFRASYERMGQRLPSAFMPNLTKASRRILLLKVTSDYDSKDINTFFKIATMYGEYLRCNEYCSGFEVILDYRYGNIINHIAHINPLALKQIATIALEGYGFRIKGIHLVTSSKAISLFVNLLKQVISAKLFSRINVIQNIEDLYEYVPQELMPFEYGGKEKSLKELHDAWMYTLTSKEFLEYYNKMNKACTIESRRNPDIFNEKYLGISGSFRALTVD